VPWADISVGDGYVKMTRNIIAGRANAAEVDYVLGEALATFQRSGNMDVPVGSAEWWWLVRALAEAEYAALEVSVQRDEGMPEASIVTSSPLLLVFTFGAQLMSR